MKIACYTAENERVREKEKICVLKTKSVLYFVSHHRSTSEEKPQANQTHYMTQFVIIFWF